MTMMMGRRYRLRRRMCMVRFCQRRKGGLCMRGLREMVIRGRCQWRLLHVSLPWGNLLSLGGALWGVDSSTA